MGWLFKNIVAVGLIFLGLIFWAGGAFISSLGGFFTRYVGEEAMPLSAFGGVLWFIGLIMIVGGIYLMIKARRQAIKEGKQFLKETIAEAISDTQVVKCKKCGAENKEGSRFCASCGAKF